MDTLELCQRASRTEEAKFLAIGDVRDVLYSRADRVRPLPGSITHGFGLLSDGGPAGAGEGILIRGLAALTPPTPAAGRILRLSDRPTALNTSFFLGWKGEPSAVGWFRNGSTGTLHSVFEGIFQELDREADRCPLIFLEVVALFRLSQIRDRALCKPVDAGGSLITTEHQSTRYFRFSPILSDLGHLGDPLLPLAITGVGFRFTGAWTNEAEIASSAFYKPPGRSAQENVLSTTVRTHSHALAWHEAEETVQNLRSVLAKPDLRSIEEDLDRNYASLLSSEPSHLVHLDDWSSAAGGLFRAFVPAREDCLEILQP